MSSLEEKLDEVLKALKQLSEKVDILVNLEKARKFFGSSDYYGPYGVGPRLGE